MYRDSVVRHTHMDHIPFSVLCDDGHQVVTVVALDVFQVGAQLIALIDQVEQDVFEKVDIQRVVLSAVFGNALMLPKSGNNLSNTAICNFYYTLL